MPLSPQSQLSSTANVRKGEHLIAEQEDPMPSTLFKKQQQTAHISRLKGDEASYTGVRYKRIVNCNQEWWIISPNNFHLITKIT